MPAPLVRSAVLVSCALWALACQSAPPSAPEEPAGPAGGLAASVVLCDGKPATHVLTPGGPGTDGSWFYGTGGKDVIVGTAGADRIDGMSGADRICLLEGDDVARGGFGADRLFGDAGADQLKGQDDGDRLDGGADDDALDGGSGRDKLFGGPGLDDLHGGPQNDQLDGGPADDTLFGNLGDDLLEGEAGVDALDGGAGTDTCAGGGQVGDTTTACELALIQLVAGGNHACILTAAGAAYCWGEDGSGQLGDGTVGSPTFNPTPVAVVGGHTFANLYAGGPVTCGVKSDGSGYCWGADSDGQLGDGSAGGTRATPALVTGGHTWASLAPNFIHTCGLRTDGAAYCWGTDAQGQSGDGTAGGLNATPVAVTGGHVFVTIATGFNHSCGVRTDGAAYCWGYDGTGQLGDGTEGPTNNPTPAAVTGGHTWASLTGGDSHTCGIRTDGAAYCWGWNGLGQLGDGTSGSNNPTPSAVIGGHTFSSISAGLYHSCGLRTDGAGYCWGRDSEGQLGDGTIGPQSATPTAVTGGHTFATVEAGNVFSCGLRSNGSVYCWGSDDSGALGDGTTGSPTLSPTPTAVIGLP